LARTRIAVLLVSQDFLASDFIRNDELPSVLHAAHSGEIVVVCVSVRSNVVDLVYAELLTALAQGLEPSSVPTHRSWWTLPAHDAYAWQHLGSHLVKADLRDETSRPGRHVTTSKATPAESAPSPSRTTAAARLLRPRTTR
jgi:hypothetical protein